MGFKGMTKHHFSFSFDAYKMWLTSINLLLIYLFGPIWTVAVTEGIGTGESADVTKNSLNSGYEISTSSGLKNAECVVKLKSWTITDLDKSGHVILNDVIVQDTSGTRGIAMSTIDLEGCTVLENKQWDTFASLGANLAVADFLDAQDEGTAIAFASMDSFCYSPSSCVMIYESRVGASFAEYGIDLAPVQYKSKFAGVGVKGHPHVSVFSLELVDLENPCCPVELEVNLNSLNVIVPTDSKDVKQTTPQQQENASPNEYFNDDSPEPTPVRSTWYLEGCKVNLKSWASQEYDRTGYIQLNGETVQDISMTHLETPGFAITAILPEACSIFEKRFFQTYGNQTETLALADFLDGLNNGTIIAFASADSFCQIIGWTCQKTMKSHLRLSFAEYGIDIMKIGWRTKFVGVGVKGQPCKSMISLEEWKAGHLCCPVKMNANLHALEDCMNRPLQEERSTSQMVQVEQAQTEYPEAQYLMTTEANKDYLAYKEIYIIEEQNGYFDTLAIWLAVGALGAQGLIVSIYLIIAYKLQMKP